jgi:hypothetical protein
MKQRYLEVTFRNGKPLAAYLYLPRNPGDVSVRTARDASGLLVDYAADGRAIGIEIPSPGKIRLEALNQLLVSLDQGLATPEELAPVGA